uniref:Uncharacterized protein n=1 Tax=Oryza sativa subsp. japonica TaxID=39947 RepID=Q5Z5J3_ORYSJ|nr:hypothetical protein [Oryza sativa Japonica Group]BAD62061.1 hypothetical protein [Oryza sativa Japonica Group]
MLLLIWGFAYLIREKIKRKKRKRKVEQIKRKKNKKKKGPSVTAVIVSLVPVVFVAVSTKPPPFFLVIEPPSPTGLEGRGRVDLPPALLLIAGHPRRSSHCRCSSPSHRRFSSLSRESPVVALVLLAAPLPPWALRILLAEPFSLPALLLVGSPPGLLSRCHRRPSSSSSRYRRRHLLAEPPTALLLLVSSEERERERERV